MVWAYFSAFSLSLLKLCCNSLSFFIRMFHSSPISITSPFLFQHLTQLIRFFNSFCCAILLGRIEIFFMFFSQLLNIQTGGALQACYFYNFFAHQFLQIKTCSSPRRPLFLHALSFECTSKLCITFLNQYSAYFHILTMHNTIQSLIFFVHHFFQK